MPDVPIPCPPPANVVRAADVIVSGAGAAGIVAAVALGRLGLRVVCAGISDTRPNGRTVALFEGSIRFLRAIDAWAPFDATSQRIKAIRLIDDTGLRLPVPPLTLAASDIGLEALGANVENHRLVAGLLDLIATMPNVAMTGTFLRDIDIRPDGVRVVDTNGDGYEARLLVAADGRKSPARLAAQIGAQTWTYPQVAMTGIVAHARPHEAISVEFHTRTGPCTLVPLQGTSESPHRSSLVWLMSPDAATRRRALDATALARELEQQTRRRLGAMRFEPERGVFPMGGLKVNRLAAPRIVLIGEAAHAFPPLAAQGLNLSLRDIAQLQALVRDAHATGADIGAISTLRPYERARRRDIALRTNGVDVLNRSIMTEFAPVDAARGVGALALRLVGPLRRAIMREGILPPGPTGGDAAPLRT